MAILQFDKIYNTDEYLNLNAKLLKGESVVFDCNCEFGHIRHRTIKRKIDGTDYYDLISPYGYGGSELLLCKDKDKLLTCFLKEYSSFCEKNKIVSEFIRFNPLTDNAGFFGEIFNAQQNRKVLLTDVSKIEDFDLFYTKEMRKTIRQAKNRGAEVSLDLSLDMKSFEEIYFDTMDRNNATSFYYFDEEYFRDLTEKFRDRLIKVDVKKDGKRISSMLSFIVGEYISIHLSGTKNEFLNLSPAYLMRDFILRYAKEKGIRYVFHGGGRSSLLSDGLYLFKKQFSNEELDFFVGKVVWNREVYNSLSKGKEDGEFFPKYRFKE